MQASRIELFEKKTPLQVYPYKCCKKFLNTFYCRAPKHLNGPSVSNVIWLTHETIIIPWLTLQVWWILGDFRFKFCWPQVKFLGRTRLCKKDERWLLILLRGWIYWLYSLWWRWLVILLCVKFGESFSFKHMYLCLMLKVW